MTSLKDVLGLIRNADHSALDIARYFLSKKDEDAGELISNLKLQKLLYYSQGFYLALHNKPLFDDEIEAWTHGPVVPNVYHEYKGHGNSGIPSPEDMNYEKYKAEVREFLDDIYNVLGQYSAWKLRTMTHSEAPWSEAYEKGAKTITHESMKKYFTPLVAK